MCLSAYVHAHVHMHTERGRERERERGGETERLYQASNLQVPVLIAWNPDGPVLSLNGGPVISRLGQRMDVASISAEARTSDSPHSPKLASVRLPNLTDRAVP